MHRFTKTGGAQYFSRQCFSQFVNRFCAEAVKLPSRNIAAIKTSSCISSQLPAVRQYMVKTQTMPVKNQTSAIPPKADMCGALCHVGFGPIADIRAARIVTLSAQSIRPVRGDHWIRSGSYFAPCPVCSCPSKYECQEVAGHPLPLFWRVADHRTQLQNHAGYVRQSPKDRLPAAPHGIERDSPLHLTRPLLPTEQDT